MSSSSLLLRFLTIPPTSPELPKCAGPSDPLLRIRGVHHSPLPAASSASTQDSMLISWTGRPARETAAHPWSMLGAPARSAPTAPPWSSRRLAMYRPVELNEPVATAGVGRSVGLVSCDAVLTHMGCRGYWRRWLPIEKPPLRHYIPGQVTVSPPPFPSRRTLHQRAQRHRRPALYSVFPAIGRRYR